MRGWITNRTYFKNEDENQKLKMGGGSWSINLKEVSSFDVDNVEYRTHKAFYRIPFALAQSKGFVRMMKGEPKLIVPVKFWEKKTNEKI